MQTNFTKRQKEQARAQKQKEKAAKKAERKRVKDERPTGPNDGHVDPDIAGIVPGPQPPLPEFQE